MRVRSEKRVLIKKKLKILLFPSRICLEGSQKEQNFLRKKTPRGKKIEK